MYQANAPSLVTLNTDPDESYEQKGNKQEFLYRTT